MNEQHSQTPVITMVKLSDVVPYFRNPRNCDNSVSKCVESIKQFGFQGAIILDVNRVIICGHTRYRAASELGLDSIPCIISTTLSPTQVKAYRLADNKVGESTEYILDKLAEELAGCTEFNMSDFGFELLKDETECTDIDDLINEYDIKNAVEKPIWATLRTSEDKRQDVDAMVKMMAERGIKVEVSYEETM